MLSGSAAEPGSSGRRPGRVCSAPFLRGSDTNRSRAA